MCVCVSGGEGRGNFFELNKATHCEKKVRMGGIRMVHVEYTGSWADVGCEKVQKARCETWELCKGRAGRGRRTDKSVGCEERKIDRTSEKEREREMIQIRDEASAG